MKMSKLMNSLTAKFAAVALAFTCAGSAWGATTVATEAELRAAIASGGNVILGADIALTQGEIAVSNTVTLDLGTYTISSPTNVFRVAANGNFTVNADATNPGGISVPTNRCCVYASYGWDPGAKTVVLNGGVFTGNCVFNWSETASQNIEVLYGFLPDGYGSGEKTVPTSVTINGGTFTGGYEEGNVGAYRCYYFTVNGGTFERGLDCADTPTCSIGVTTTCKAFFNGGRYRDRYPTFRRKQYADDPGKVFIGTEYHTNVYYYADGYYVNAYDYSACQCTGRWRGAMVEDANILLYMVTQCWQNWMSNPTRKVWYFLTVADAQSVNAGSITPVNGTENVVSPLTSAAGESVRSATATVFAASPLKSAKRLLGATSQEVPLAKGNSESDNTSPDSVSADWRDKITVSSIAGYSSSFASLDNDVAYTKPLLDDLEVRDNQGLVENYEAEEEKIMRFVNREDMDACYVFALKGSVEFANGTDWKIVVKLSRAAADKSMEFYLGSGNAQISQEVDKRVLLLDSSSLEYVLPHSPNKTIGDYTKNTGLLGNFKNYDKSNMSMAFPFLVAIKNTDSENEGIRVEVQFRIGDTVCAAYTHDIGEYVPEGKKPVEGSFSEYHGNNEHWGEYDISLKDDSGNYMGLVYSDTRAKLSAVFNTIENVSETGLESVEIAADDGVSLEKWVQIEWHGLVGVRNGAPMTTFAFGVEPMLAATIGNETTTRAITNTELNNQTIKFRLPLTDAYTARALVVHTSDDANIAEERWIANVAGSVGARYVEISTTHFSEFTVSPIGADDIVYVTSAAGAFIGGYTTLADAYAATEDGGTIYLLQNISEDISVSTAKTFNINKGEFTYSGTVTAADGISLASSTSGATTTYTATALPVVATVTANDVTTNFWDLHAALEAGKAAGSVVTLLDDVDLTGVAWVPVGTAADKFYGSIDGNGKVISNLSIDKAGSNYAALIGYAAIPNLGDSLFANLTISNVVVRGDEYVGALLGDGYQYATISNITLIGSIDIRGHKNVGGLAGGSEYGRVVDCSVVGDGNGIIEATYTASNGDGENVGGISGHISESKSLRFKNCSVSGITVLGAAKVGGIAGVAFLNNDIENVSAKDIKVGLNTTTDYTGVEGNGKLGVGGLVGVYYTNGSNNGKISGTVEDVTIIANANGIDQSHGLVTGGLNASKNTPVTLPTDPVLTATGYDYAGLIAKGYDAEKYNNSYLINNYVATVTDSEGNFVGGYSTVDAALTAVKTLAGATVNIFAGSYTLTTTSYTFADGVTVIGEKDSEGNNLVTFNNKELKFVAKDFTLKDINIVAPSGSALHYAKTTGLFEHVNITSPGNGIRECQIFPDGTMTFKDCNINAGTYGIHYDTGAGSTINIIGGSISGWNSFGSVVKQVNIIGTEFPLGTSYNQLRFYQDAVISNATFNGSMNLDFGQNGESMILSDCVMADGSDVKDHIRASDLANENRYVAVGNGVVLDEDGKIVGGVFEVIDAGVIADGYISIPNEDSSTSSDYPLTVGGPYAAVIYDENDAFVGGYNGFKTAIDAANASSSTELTVKLLCDIEEPLPDDLEAKKTLLITTDVTGGVELNLHSESYMAFLATANGCSVTFDSNVNVTGIRQLGTYADTAVLNLNNPVRLSQFYAAGGTININPDARIRFYHDGAIHTWGAKYVINGSLGAGEGLTATVASVGAENLQIDGGYVNYRYHAGAAFTMSNAIIRTQFSNGAPGDSNTFPVTLYNSVIYATGSSFSMGTTSQGTLTLIGSRIVADGATVDIDANDNVVMDWKSSITAKNFTNTGKVVLDMAGFDGAFPITLVSTTDAAAQLGDFEVINNTSGATLMLDANGNIVAVEAVAQIGDEQYGTLEAAIAAAQDGDTVTLLKDFSMTAPISTSKNIDLDGAGHKITAEGSGSGILFYFTGNSTVKNLEVDSKYYKYCIVFEQETEALATTAAVSNCVFKSDGVTLAASAYTTLTVQDSSVTHKGAYVYDKTGSYSGESTWAHSAVAAMSGATINIESGTYDSDTYTAIIFSSGGTFNISGGTFTVTGPSDNQNRNTPQVLRADNWDSTPPIVADSGFNVSGGTFDGPIEIGSYQTTTYSILKISDGTFTNYGITKTGTATASISGGKFSTQVAVADCADGYSPTTTPDANGMYTVISDFEAQIVRNGEVILPKGTLAEMVAAAQDGDTVQLLKDVEISSTVTLNLAGNVTIDGNGYTVTPSAGFSDVSAFLLGATSATTIGNGNYTIANTTFSGFNTTYGVLRCQGSTVNIADCTFAGNEQTDKAWGVVSGTHACLAVQDCTFTGNTCAKCIDFNYNGGGTNAGAGSLTVTGNLFSDNTISRSGVIFSNGSTGTADSITGNTFSGNTINASAGAVLYISGTVEDISGNLFENNNITAEAGQKEAVIVLGSGSTGTAINDNAFVGNVLGTGSEKRATVYTGADCDLSGNYWGDGAAPETGTGLDIRIDDGKTPVIAVTGHATAYATSSGVNGATVTVQKYFYQDAEDANLWHVVNLIGLKEFRDSVNAGTSYAGKTIRIESDIDMTGTEWTPIEAYPGYLLSGSTIDGANHTIRGLTVVTPAPASGYSYGSGFIGKTAGELTVKDLAFVDATVNAPAGSQVGTIVGMSYGNVTLSNVDLQNCAVTGVTKTGGYVGQNDDGTVSLTNCDLVNTKVYANYSGALMIGLLNTNAVGMEFSDCTADADSKFVWISVAGEFEDKGSVTIAGRTYAISGSNLWVTDPGEGCWAEQRVEGATYDGYNVRGSIFYPAYVAMIGSTGYTTLADAIAAAQSGDTVTLLTDIEVTEKVSIAKSIVLDGNGKKITATTADAKASGYYVLEFVAEQEGMSLTVKNLEVEATGFQTVLLANCDYDTPVTISNVKFTSDGSCVYANGYAKVSATNSEFKHEGAYVAGKDPVYYAALQAGYSGEITLDGCKVESTDYGIVTFPSGGTVNIKDTEVTISGTPVVSDPAAIWSRVDNGYTHSYASSSTVNILEGAKIRGALKTTNTDTTGKTSKLVVSGGMFSEDINSLNASATDTTGVVFAAGYIPTANTDSTTSAAYPYTVKEGCYVARIGSMKYETLAEAVAKVNSDASSDRETIEILVDCDEVLTINTSYPILIDGRGHKIGQGAASTASAMVITAANADVVVSNAIIGNSGITRGINVNAANVSVAVVDSAVYASSYTINVYGTGHAVDGVNIAVTNSTVCGYAALNLWGAGGKVDVAGSVLAATNTASYSSARGYAGNDFGVIVFESEGSSTGDYASGYTVYVTNSTISAGTVNGNCEDIVLYNPYASDNTVRLDGCTIQRGTAVDTSGMLCELQGTSGNSLYVRNTTDAATSAIPVLPDGYAYANADSEGWRLVIKPVVAVIAADGVTTNGVYGTLEAAYDAASAGDTVALLADITYDANRSVPVWDKAVNIDLGGHTLTTNSEVNKDASNNGYKAAAICFSIPAANAGSVTICNGTIVTAYGAGVYADDPGLTLTLSNLTINAATAGTQSTAEYSAAVRVTGGAKVIIESGSYSGAYAIAASNSGADFEINGGTFTGGIFFSASTDSGKTKSVTITGGAFSGGYVNADKGTLTISGGVYAQQPAASYAATGYFVIPNVDPATKVAYPWTVGSDIVYPTGGDSVGVPVPASWIKDNTDLIEEGQPVNIDTVTNGLAQAGANGVPVWQSYVLGLNPKDATSQVKLVGAKASADGKVAIKGLNVNVPAVLAAQGTTVVFHLEESVPGSDSWTVRSETFTVDKDGNPVFTVPLSDVNGKVLRIMADIVTVSK